MKKSLIALLLVLALVVTVSVFAVSAETPLPTQLTSELTENGDGTATGYCPHCKNTATFTAWTPGAANTTECGHFYLAADQANPENRYFRPNTAGDLIIHLNGHTLQRAQGALIITDAAAQIYLLDNSSGKGTLQTNGAWGSTCSVVSLNQNGASFNMYSGNLVYNHTAGTRAASGGVLLSSSATTFNIYGGTITTSDVTGYGAVGFFNGATVNVHGGTITGAKATGAGGVFHFAGKWHFTMTGGTITGGSAANGGNLSFAKKDSTWTETDICIADITGGTISGGIATGNGGNIYVSQDSVVRLSNCTVTGGTSQATAATSNAGAAGGGNLYLSSGANVTVGTGAVISNGTAAANGGNICAIYGGTHYSRGFITVDGGKITGGTAPFGGSVSIGNNNDLNVQNGGQISGGTCTGTAGISGANSNGGGNVWAVKSANVNINEGGIVTGGSAEKARGGNIYSANGSVKINVKGGTVTKGTAAHGGNIGMNQSGGTVNFTAGVISEGDATNGGGVFGAWGSKYNMSGTAKLENNTATNGGNVYVAGVYLNISGGTVTGGNATSNGGNMYLEGSSYGTITNTVISDGVAGGSGGNIALLIQNSNQNTSPERAVGVTLGEGTQLLRGKATAFGGNIYISQMYAIVTLDGAVLDGTGCTGGSGKNIGVWNVDTLNIQGNTVIKNGGKIGKYYDSVYLGDCDDDDTNDAATFNLKVNLGGKADVDYIYFSGYINDGYDLASLNIKSDFAGNAKLYWQGYYQAADKSVTLTDYQEAGTVVACNVAVEENYANAGKLFVHDDTSSAKPVAYYDTNADGAKELATTGMAGVTAEGVEIPITALPTDDTYAYVKLFSGFEALTLVKNEIIDQNNMGVHFVTGDKKLTVLNYRTDGGKVSADEKGFTVDNEANMEKLGVNPLNGNRYICVKGEDGRWTSNHIVVSIDSVSIKPMSASVYYNTKIMTNANVAPLIDTYGVAVSLQDEPTADFRNQGTVLYTAIEGDFTDKVDIVTNSALIEGVFKKGEDNDARGKMKIFANAYVTVGDVTVMADEVAKYSLYDLMVLVDQNDALAANEKVVNMYKEWQDPLAQWDLNKIAAAAGTNA